MNSQAVSGAIMAGGTSLAMAGLTGSRRGTWGGIGESTAGGAMIGWEVGGPLGAAIGAAAGFAAGGIEKLLGVISPEQKVHNDVKSIYGVDLPVNSSTVKQIVGLAQSQFGGNIAVAVRSPSVRQLVLLYSEATGQKMPLSAATPYGGSLAESGGNLYQQATYQDGQAHVYASNLPTLGGLPTTPYPTPGGGTTVAININGTPITPQFITDGVAAGQESSYGRTQQAANLQVPGLMVA